MRKYKVSMLIVVAILTIVGLPAAAQSLREDAQQKSKMPVYSAAMAERELFEAGILEPGSNVGGGQFTLADYVMMMSALTLQNSNKRGVEVQKQNGSGTVVGLIELGVALINKFSDNPPIHIDNDVNRDYEVLSISDMGSSKIVETPVVEDMSSANSARNGRSNNTLHQPQSTETVRRSGRSNNTLHQPQSAETVRRRRNGRSNDTLHQPQSTETGRNSRSSLSRAR